VDRLFRILTRDRVGPVPADGRAFNAAMTTLIDGSAT
jgi:hypothetical protein